MSKDDCRERPLITLIFVVVVFYSSTLYVY